MSFCYFHKQATESNITLTDERCMWILVEDWVQFKSALRQAAVGGNFLILFASYYAGEGKCPWRPRLLIEKMGVALLLLLGEL